MTPRILPLMAVALFMALGCARHGRSKSSVPPAPNGATLAVVSGDKQIGTIGATLDQSVVVQVNDAQNNGIAGVGVWLTGSSRMQFNPPEGITDASGQLTTQVSLDDAPGRYQFTAHAREQSGKQLEANLTAVALGYQQTLGRELDARYCSRCHSQESTPAQVSNYDNLTTKPHAFTDGDSLNGISDANLELIITHGGAAANKSPEMPAYGNTLSNSDVKALVAYIRSISDPPYSPTGLTYANP